MHFDSLLISHLATYHVMLAVQDESVSIKEVVCSSTDTAIVLSDGRCFVSGLNKQGQLGLGHKNAVQEPTLLPNFNVKTISVGQNASALLDSEGELYTFGFGGSTFNGIGQLGHGDANSYLEPKLVHSIVEDGCYSKQVTVGESHTTVLTTEGEVLCTGGGSYGRLGNFETSDQVFFEPVELLTSGVDQISGGKSFTLALRDGVVYGWGRNHKGQVRDSSYSFRQHVRPCLTPLFLSLALVMVWRLICTPCQRFLLKLSLTSWPPKPSPRLLPVIRSQPV